MKTRKMALWLSVFALLGWSTLFAEAVTSDGGSTETTTTADTTSTSSTEDTASPDGGSADSSDQKPGLGFGMALQFGSQTINGTNYNAIRLQPDLKFGKFGIGLDINLEIDGNGNFRVEEWNTWQAILCKFLYISWGEKGRPDISPVYAKIGSIDDFTLGHGLIMYKYSNMLNYPAVKKLGLAFDMDLKYFGMETMVGNVFDFDILGARMYGRPLFGTKIPLVNKLEIGASIAVDLDPQNPTPDPATPYAFTDGANSTNVTVWGVDLGLPVVPDKLRGVFSADVYFDFIGIVGKGSGEFLGVAGNIVSFIPYKLEARLFQPGFMPVYFDSFYDSTRSIKYQSLDSITNTYGGWYFSSGLALFPNDKTKKPQLTWALSIEGSFDGTTKPILTMDFIIAKELLMNKLGLQFSWVRQEIGQFADIFKYENENSIMYLILEYYISESLAITLNYKRTFSVNESGVIEPFTSTSIATKFTF